MSKTFNHSVSIKFHLADPAGIMYFGHIFSLAHDCYEQFVQAAGYSWNQYFLSSEHIFPIRHAECDYQKPFLAGQSYDVTISVAHFSNTTFKMNYLFSKDQETHAVVRIVHVCLDPKTHAKSPLPKEFKEKLSPYLHLEEKI